MMLISTRQEGTMRLGARSSAENRRRFFARLGVREDRVVSADLAHGARAVRVSSSDAGSVIPGTDSLVTNDPSLLLSVTSADCLPVAFADGAGTFALAHAGWKGLARDVLGSTVSLMQRELGVRARDLRAFIGPGICVRCYRVREDCIREFGEVRPVVAEGPEGLCLDLKETARRRLLDLGLLHVRISSDCTSCMPDTYFSYRRDRTDPVDAMIVLAGDLPLEARRSPWYHGGTRRG